MVKLKLYLCSFYGHHHDFVNRYWISVSQMISDWFLTNVTYRIRIITWFVLMSNTTDATCRDGYDHPPGAPKSPQSLVLFMLLSLYFSGIFRPSIIYQWRTQKCPLGEDWSWYFSQKQSRSRINFMWRQIRKTSLNDYFILIK